MVRPEPGHDSGDGKMRMDLRNLWGVGGRTDKTLGLRNWEERAREMSEMTSWFQVGVPETRKSSQVYLSHKFPPPPKALGMFSLSPYITFPSLSSSIHVRVTIISHRRICLQKTKKLFYMSVASNTLWHQIRARYNWYVMACELTARVWASLNLPLHYFSLFSFGSLLLLFLASIV